MPKKNLQKAVTAIFVSNIISRIIGLFGLIYFSRILGAAIMGQFFLFQAVLGLLLIPSNFGLREAANKRISQKSKIKGIFATVIALKIILVLIISVVIIANSNVINAYVGAKISSLLALAVATREFSLLFDRILKGELRVFETASFKIIQNICWLFGGLLGVYYGLGIYGLIYGLIIGYFVTLMVGIYKVSISLGFPTREAAISLVEYSKYSTLTALGSRGFGWIDVTILGVFVAHSLVGAYETAWRVAVSIVMLSNALATTSFPQISHWYHSGDREKVKYLISNMFVPALYFIIPAFVGSIFVAEELLGLVFGEGFAVAGYALIILIFGMLARSHHTILNDSLRAIDKPDWAAYALTVGLGSNIIFNLILVPKFGIKGAAVATSVSLLITSILDYIFIRKKVQLSYPYAPISWCIASSAFMGMVIAATLNVISIGSYLELFIIIAFGAVLYVGGTLPTPLRAEMIHTVRNIIR